MPLTSSRALSLFKRYKALKKMLEIDNYIKKHRLEISELIKGKTIIYLDTNHWLNLRDQNRESEPDKRILLDIIIELSDSGKCIFPISEITFWEFLKQSDLETLKETSVLVDRLSKGISMINSDERRILEFTHFYYKNTGQDTFELNELIWTKLPLILGYESIAKLKTEELQKSFFDFVSNATLLDIITNIYKDGVIEKSFYFKDDIKTLNQEKQKYANENNSFKQIFLSELGGYLDNYQEIFSDVIYNDFLKISKREFSQIERDSVPKDNKYKNLIYNGFKSNKLNTELPVFRIVPELFASARWNTNRIFRDGNDTLDFLHASFALPYCDYFFTEGDLKSMIEQTKQDKLYGCLVENKQKSIIKELEKIRTLCNNV